MSRVSSDPRIHILLPVHNRRPVTEAFLHCLRVQTYGIWHLVLIDDGSSDGTAEMASALVPDLTLLRGKGDWWWAGSLHQGYQWVCRTGVAAEDVVLIINDDTEFAPDFLQNAVSAMRPASLLLAQAYRSNGEFCEAGVFWDWKEMTCTGVGDKEEINCFSTRGLFLRAGDLRKIGGFYPRLLPHYLSDYEFTIRASRKGFGLVSDPSVSLRYFEALTGIRSTEGLSTWETLKTNLSIKSASNPLYWTSFLLLSCPRRYLAVNLARVWWRYFLPIRIHLRPWVRRARRVLRPIRRMLRPTKLQSQQSYWDQVEKVGRDPQTSPGKAHDDP